MFTWPSRFFIGPPWAGTLAELEFTPSGGLPRRIQVRLCHALIVYNISENYILTYHSDVTLHTGSYTSRTHCNQKYNAHIHDIYGSACCSSNQPVNKRKDKKMLQLEIQCGLVGCIITQYDHGLVTSAKCLINIAVVILYQPAVSRRVCSFLLATSSLSRAGPIIFLISPLDTIA